MRYVCSGCAGEFSLPDEMLPATGKFKLKCPSCGRESVLDRDELEKDQAAQAEPAPASSAAPTPPAQAPAPPASSADPAGTSESEPEIFPPGARIAFIFLADDAWSNAVRSFFKNAGHYESLPSDINDGLEKIRLNTYHAMILEDTESNAPFLEHLALLPGRQRKELNLILIGDKAPSLDPGISFALGTNIYLNSADVSRADELLQLALDGYEEYYEPMNSAAGVKEKEE